jgi:hypothetical protein
MRTLLGCCMLMAALCAQAQWKIEIVAGPSFTTFSGKEKKVWGETDNNPKLVLRGSLGFQAERLLSEKFMAGGGISFALKGTAYEGDVTYYNSTTFTFEETNVKYTKILSYIDVPLYVKYLASDKLKVLIGLQPSFMLSAKIKNDDNARKAFPTLPKTEDAKDYYTPLDLAVLAGPQYQVSDRLAVQLLIVPGLLKVAQRESYDFNGGTEEKKFKVNNTSLSFTIVYLIHQ